MLKTCLLLVILFGLSLTFMAPVLLVNKVNEVLGDSVSQTIKGYVSTYITMFVNVVLLPFIIDMMVLVEDFETKSDR